MFNVLISINAISPLLLYPSPFIYFTKPNPIPSIFPLAKKFIPPHEPSRPLPCLNYVTNLILIFN